MKGFVFRLERLFRFREQVERQRAQELSVAVRAEQQRRVEAEVAAADLERLGGQLGAHGVATAGTLRNIGLTVHAAAQRVEAAAASHGQAAAARVAQQDRFGAARRDRRVLERLRETQADGFRIERAREEQRDLDEQASRRAAPDEEAA